MVNRGGGGTPHPAGLGWQAERSHIHLRSKNGDLNANDLQAALSLTGCQLIQIC